MKRFAILVMVSFVLVLTGIPSSAQIEDSVRYGLMFRAEDTRYVAVYDSAGEWRVDVIPTTLLFGQYDVSLQLPVWTADGDIIGVGYDPTQEFETEPIYEAGADFIYQYDVETRSLTTHAEPVVISRDPNVAMAFPMLALTSVSPTAEYVTAYDIMGGAGVLVETATGQVLVERETCGLKALEWQDNIVHLGSNYIYIVCEPVFFTFDLETNAVVTDLSDAFNDYPIGSLDNGFILGENDYLLAAYGDDVYYQLTRLTVDGFEMIVPLDIDSLQVSESRHVAVFTNGEFIHYLDLTTDETYLFPFERTYGFDMILDGDTLRYITVDGDDSQSQTVQLHTFDLENGETTTQLSLTDDTWTNVAISPSLTRIATENDGAVRIYEVADNTLLWESPPDFVMPSGEYNILWESDELLHISSAESILVDVTQGSVILPPEPNAYFISTSPDGEWLLYAVLIEDTGYLSSERLLVMNRSTGVVEVLLDGMRLYDNFHFDFQDYFVWSPLLD